MANPLRMPFADAETLQWKRSPPVQTPAPTAALGPLRVTGELVRAAESRCTTGPNPRAMVAVELATPAGLPYVAVLDMGSGFAAHLAAASKARALPRGARCTVSCQGLRVRADHGSAALVCLSVDSISQPLQHPHHEPAESPT
jgi:hypothetical protein